MNIYLIYQNDVTGYDTYDSAVVIAEDEYAARCTHPSPDYYEFINNELYFKRKDGSRTKETTSYDWVTNPFKVEVELLGVAPDDSLPRVVCASFNAG